MTTAEEMLAAALSESELEYSMSHRHSVYDSDNHFTIDPATMEIVKDPAAKGVIVQRSHNSERFTFELPRFGFDGHDMSLCNQVEVHYTNKEKTGVELTGVEHGGVYEVQDLQIYPKDSDIVVLSWLITADSTQLAGELEFALRFLCLTGTEIDYELPTAIFTGITVLPGKNNGQAVIENNTDLVAQFIQETNDQIEANMQSLEDAVTQSAASQQAAAASQAAAAEAQAAAAGSATQVQAIVAGNEAHTKYEADLRTAPPIVETAEGKTILVTDSAERPLQGLRVFGKTEQQTYTGTQLLDLSGIDNVSTAYGLTFQIKDGTIQATGVAEKAFSYTILTGAYLMDVIMTLEPGTYTLSYGELVNYNNSSESKSGTFTLTEPFEVTRYRTPTFEAGEEVDVTVKPMLNKGSTALPWEPYTGGQACPCPDYPQEFKHIESPTVEVYGKNFANIPEKFTYTQFAEKSVKIPAGKYIGSFEGETHGGKNVSSVRFLDNDIWRWFDDTLDNKTINLTKDESKLYFYSNGTAYNGSEGIEATITRFMISKEGGEYVPYKAPQTLGLAHSLPGIPVTSGGNYTDENGQQYICDEVDLARGVYVQRVGEIVFDGSQTYHINAYQLQYGYYVFGCTRAGASYSEAPMLSDKLKFKPWGHFTVDDPGNYVCYESVSFYISLADQTIQTVEAFKEYLAANPITALYTLADPVETALSAEEVTAYQAILSHYPSTTALNDSQAHMALDYVADTKTYIDNKFAALAAANS